MTKQIEQMTSEELAAELKAIAIGVTEEDRCQAVLELGNCYATVNRYLRGGVKKPFYGRKLLRFLTERQNQPA